MSLTIKHINGDSSFLLTFSPESRPSPSDLTSARGAFTILTDPWIVGPSIVSAAWFAVTTRVIPACVQDLRELEEPDVVLVSQNKPDHCHKETLRQLNPYGKTLIVAEPGAAKAIKKWCHFDPQRVVPLKKYNPKDKFSSLRLHLAPLSATGLPGEVVISFIPAVNYMTGLHNACGITYQPPTAVASFAPVPTVELPRKTPYFHMPLSPISLPPRSPPQPLSPTIGRPGTAITTNRGSKVLERPQTAGAEAYRPQPRSSRTASSEFLPLHNMAASEARPHLRMSLPSDDDLISPPFFPADPPDTAKQLTQIPAILEPEPYTLPTPPESPATPRSTSFAHQHVASFSSVSHNSSISSSQSVVTPGRPRPVSVLYTPHGIPFSPDLQPYIRHHLVRLGALPLTLLFHSFDHLQNPWYLGGNVMRGSIGGVQIARGLMARCWLSAHDEAKEDRGFAVKKLRTTSMTPEEVRRALWAGEDGEWLRKKGWNCDVRNLTVGSEMFIGPARDLLSGMEGKR